MATVRIRLSGNPLDGAELENSATEDTLLAILAAVGGTAGKIGGTQAKNKSDNMIDKALSTFSGGMTDVSETIEILAEMEPEILLVIGALKVFEVAINFVTGTINALFSVAGNMVGEFVNGKKALSDYAQALARGTEEIPIIGDFTALLASAISILDSVNATLLDLTTVGANFNGSLGNMLISSADAGMSLSEFASIVKNNAANFSTFGTVMDGVNKYTSITKITMSEYAGVLADAGISLMQYNQELPKILSLYAVSAKNRGMSDRELAESAKDLTLNFEAMSNITGKTREQQAAELADQTNDAAWQQFTTKHGEAGARYLQTLNTINETMGKSYGDLYKLSVLGLPPLNKELQVLLATTPNLSTQFKKMTEVVESGVTGAARNAAMNPLVADTVGQLIQSGQGFETAIKAASAGMGGSVADIAKAQQYLLLHSKEFIDADGRFNKDRFQQNLEHAQKLNEVSNNLSKFSTLMATLQEYFMNKVIGPLMEKIGPAIDSIISSFADGTQQDIIKSAIDWIAVMVTEFGDWLSNNKDTIKEYVANIIVIVVDVVKFIVSAAEFIINNWTQIKDGMMVLYYTFIEPIVGIVIALGELWSALDKFLYMVGLGSDEMKTPSATKTFNEPVHKEQQTPSPSGSSPSLPPQSASEASASIHTDILTKILKYSQEMAENTAPLAGLSKKLISVNS